MDVKQIEEFLKVMEKGKLRRLHLKQKDFEIELEKDSPMGAMIHQSAHPLLMPQETAAVKEKKEEGRYVTSPMVGTFYAASSPKDSPFVKVGDEIEENSVVAIIEAMKVMNEVKAKVKGKVVEILVKNGEPVEFGTKLMRVL